MVRARFGLLASLGLLGLLSGCDAPAPAACRPEGAWRADLGLYEGTAQVTPAGGDRVRVELTGKATQTGTGEWIEAARRLDFDLPSGSYRCQATADCRTLACLAQARSGSAGGMSIRLLR